VSQGGTNNRQRLELMGVDQVRMHLANNSLPGPMIYEAIQWLAELDGKERSSKESSQAEQAEIARSAKDAAWAAAHAAERAAAAAERAEDTAKAANTRATIAIIVTAIGLVIAVIGVWIVHRDTMPPPTSPVLRSP
jgi:ferric-dicitrate binding protein FerR (iron transport regulator)